MALTAALEASSIAVQPGDVTTSLLRVWNRGDVVDRVRLEVLGPAATWVSVEPAEVTIMPGEEAAIAVVVQPPRDASTRAGEQAVAVKVDSSVDDAVTVVEEFTIEVGAFVDVVAEVMPRTSTGRRRSEHQISVSNLGNAPADVTVEAGDLDQLLVFRVDPERFTVEAGETATARARVRARRWVRGLAPETRPMQFVVRGDGVADVVLDAAFLQAPAVPRAVRRALVYGALGLILLFLAWTLLVDPTLESHARNAVQDELAQPSDRPEIAPGGGGEAAGEDDGEDDNGGGAETGGGTDESAGTDAGPGSGGSTGREAIDGRLFLDAPGTTSFEVPAGRRLELTDVVLQNPRGDSGELRVLRSGTVLLVVSLDNFRDIDYHFVTPIVFTAGQKLELSATCAAPDCKPSAYFSGALVRT